MRCNEVGDSSSGGFLHLEPEHVHVHDNGPLFDVSLLLHGVKWFLRLGVTHGHREQFQFLGVPLHGGVECFFLLLQPCEDEGGVGLGDVFSIFHFHNIIQCSLEVRWNFSEMPLGCLFAWLECKKVRWFRYYFFGCFTLFRFIHIWDFFFLFWFISNFFMSFKFKFWGYFFHKSESWCIINCIARF